ncbi:putative glutaryl-CoA dehydrogenase [Toxocara canis]|uniref:Putative glutaryl-CoA dehydrogenase n=1 Tax=Toxocara canis TaxID=6265 RepID=A0A0B2VKI1_TOXCA|nr:putative glutaryl-CoA dehydrogenase [Toxocara canis]
MFSFAAGSMFNYKDALDFHGQLSAEERSLVDQTREYCHNKLLRRVVDAYRSEKFDPTLLPEMGKMGLLGAPYQGYGCVGTSFVGYGLLAREVEAIDSGYRSAVSVQTSLVIGPIYNYGSEKQVHSWIGGWRDDRMLWPYGTQPWIQPGRNPRHPCINIGSADHRSTGIQMSRDRLHRYDGFHSHFRKANKRSACRIQSLAIFESALSSAAEYVYSCVLRFRFVKSRVMN